jgi:hypothetical protein
MGRELRFLGRCRSALPGRACSGLGVVAIAASSLLGCTSDGGGAEQGAPTDFCTNVERFESLQAEGDSMFDASAEVPVEQLRDVFGRFRDAIDALVDSAPDAVAADVALVGATTEQLIDAYEQADFDFVALATDPRYAEVLAGLDDVQITEANDRLATYFRQQCGSG